MSEKNLDPKERPILFSTSMVKAILEGRKTTTRRIVKFPKDYTGGEVYKNYPFGLKYQSNEFEGCIHRLSPKWQVGDVLWVKETYSNLNIDFKTIAPYYVYKADLSHEHEHGPVTWKPSIFMPKVAARIWLEITDIKVERLQDISEGDAEKEGSEAVECGPVGCCKCGFYEIWKKINGEESWNKNPWVWCISFNLLPAKK